MLFRSHTHTCTCTKFLPLSGSFHRPHFSLSFHLSHSSGHLTKLSSSISEITKTTEGPVGDRSCDYRQEWNFCGSGPSHDALREMFRYNSGRAISGILLLRTLSHSTLDTDKSVSREFYEWLFAIHKSPAQVMKQGKRTTLH